MITINIFRVKEKTVEMKRSLAPSMRGMKMNVVNNDDSIVSTTKNERIVNRIVIRDSFMPLLQVPRSKHYIIEEKLFQPFKSPVLHRRRTTANYNIKIRKRLGCVASGHTSLPQFATKFTVPWKNGISAVPRKEVESSVSSIKSIPYIFKFYILAPPYVKLVLWSKDSCEKPLDVADVELRDEIFVPEVIGRFLRPHQRAGVKFLFDSVFNLNKERKKNDFGCILADDMGFGKSKTLF